MCNRSSIKGKWRAEQAQEERSGFNRQLKPAGRNEPKMHTVDHCVAAALVGSHSGSGPGASAAQGAGISAAVSNQLRQAEHASTTSVVHIKDKKVCTVVNYSHIPWHDAMVPVSFFHQSGTCVNCASKQACCKSMKAP